MIKENSFLISKSWDSLLRVLYKIQNRLFKSAYVSDMVKVFAFQQLILKSSVTRLLSVREITQLDSKRKLKGVDGRVCLTFTEKFEICEELRLNLFSWSPALVRRSPVVNREGKLVSLDISTIKDRCWHCLVKFSLEPVHEANFSFRSFGARSSIVSKLSSAT